MLDFIKTKGFHDTCENYCPDVVYDYLKNQGWWEHLFHRGMAEQLMDYVQENPGTAMITGAAIVGGAVFGSAYAMQKIKAKSSSDSKDEIKAVVEDTGQGLLISSSSVHTVQVDHIEENRDDVQELKDTIVQPIAQPKQLPVTTILSKAFDFIKENFGEQHSVLAQRLDLQESSIAQFKLLPGVAKLKSQFMQQVVNGHQRGKALAILGLPQDGSYPQDDRHYLALAEAIGMPSPKEDKGVRIHVGF